MKAILYELSVPMSTMDWIHGEFTTIQEIYVPDHEMCFNSKGFAFKTSPKRYEPNEPGEGMPKQPDPVRIKELDISINDVEKIINIINQREIVNGLSTKFFGVNIHDDV